MRGTRTQWTNHPYLFEGLIIFFGSLLLESNSCPAFCQITLVYEKGTRVHYPSNFHGFPPLDEGQTPGAGAFDESAIPRPTESLELNCSEWRGAGPGAWILAGTR